MAVSVEYVVDPGPIRHGPGLAPGDLVPRKALQFQRDVFDDVADPGAFVKPPGESPRRLVAAAVSMQAGEQGQNPLYEAGNPVRRPRL